MAAETKTRIRLMAGILLSMCLILCGCTEAPLLSQREIVRAVFFQQQGTESRALLLLSDNAQSQEGTEPQFRTVLGKGKTPDQALTEAENQLEGQVFYGLMDVAALPLQSDWNASKDLVELLYEKTKPAPQMTLYMMDETEEQNLLDSAEEVYDKMEKAKLRYGLNNGLQIMLSAANECALPVWQGTGYGFVFLQEGKENTMLENPLAAQMAAVLAGQADRFQCAFDQGNAMLQVRASVQHRADLPGQNELQLTLTNPDIQDLGGKERSELQLQKELCNELQQAFGAFVSKVYTDMFDPLKTRVWVTATNGIREQIPVPKLLIHIEE